MKYLSTHIAFGIFMLIFAMSKLPQQKGEAARYKGLFLCPQKYSGSSLRVIVVMAITSPFARTLTTVIVGCRFNYLLVKNIATMKPTPKVSTSVDATTATNAVESLLIYDTPGNLLATANKLHGFFIAHPALPDTFRSDAITLCNGISDLLETIK